jgi:peptidyl-prolyl cis-trans isomerase C
LPASTAGGDLGYFRRDQVWPGFADLAFSLQPGQVGPVAVKNEFGWHVIKVEDRRMVPAASYADLHEAIRQELMQQAIQDAVQQARARMPIRKFNLDGSEIDDGPRPARLQSLQAGSAPMAPAAVSPQTR